MALCRQNTRAELTRPGFEESERMRETTTFLSHLKPPRSLWKPFNRNQSGMTLVEIMIVIGIIAAVIGLGAPRLFNTGASMRAAVRQLGIVPREARSFARLYNVTMRIVIEMDDEKGHRYWVETGSDNALLLSEEQQEELDRLTSAQREDESVAQTQFQIEKKITPKPKTLPRGLYFESVELKSREGEITEGRTYIHFFSKGLAEEAAIHITDRKTLNWTIAIHPLTGRADVLERKVMLKELTSQ